MTMVYLGGDKPTITTIDQSLTKEELRINVDIYQRMIAGMAIEIAIDRSAGGEVHWDPKEVIDEYYQKAKAKLEG